ncbi:MAG: hypothetical protein JNM68_11400 [Dinghuibacter sp.]|nr:hypothetical protein [Dinghuibacter sp.]
MVPRKMTAIGRHLLKKYPVLTITGPRQSGKSTFAKMLQPGFIYAIECKSSQTLQPAYFKGLEYFSEISPVKTKGICFYGGDEDHVYKNYTALSWKSTTKPEIR